MVELPSLLRDLCLPETTTLPMHLRTLDSSTAVVGQPQSPAFAVAFVGPEAHLLVVVAAAVRSSSALSANQAFRSLERLGLQRSAFAGLYFDEELDLGSLVDGVLA